MLTALVYHDEGTSKRSVLSAIEMLKASLPPVWKVDAVSSDTLKNTSWEENTSLLVFPGGRDIPYQNNLGGIGCQKIRNYIERGGRFLGICAGAYFACRDISFEEGGPLEVLAQRDLGFFPGIAQGPALGKGKFAYDSENGADAARIFFSEKKTPLRVYYNGGCLFLDAHKHPNIEILATYMDIPSQPACIILCPFGKGKALLSGVHIEIAYQDLPEEKSHLEFLKASEEKRKDLVGYLLHKLL